MFVFTKVDSGTPVEKLFNNRVLRAIAETIKEAGWAPRGILYAAVMQHWSLDQFTAALGLLETAGLIRQTSEVATWIGDANGEVGLFGERLP